MLLIIAPQSDLDVNSEIMDAVGDEATKIVHGDVPIRQVLDLIKSGLYDKMHFAGDSNTVELRFSDGVLENALLADAIRHAGTVQLCVFNSCESLGMALAAYMAGAAYAIGWQDRVENETAVDFAFSFWASYKMSGDVGGAFRTGREAVIWRHPGQQAPALLNGRGEAYRDRMSDMNRQMGQVTRMAYVLAILLVFSVLLNLADVLYFHW